MPFNQRVRLPFYLTRPQLPASSNVFRLANGGLRNLSSQVRKVYEGETDYMPENWHVALRIALMHDNITIESAKFVGSVALEGEGYDIDWQKFQDYPTAKADFKVQVDNFDFSNSNCITCDEATQLNLTDDNFGTIAEGGSGSGNVFLNDVIFCSPVVASITNYDPVYLAAAPTINNDGNVSFTLKSPLPSVTAAKIFTYRVTCPNGGYDEADVYIEVDGSMAGCSAPENVRDLVAPTQTTADVTWDENGSPADGYYWELYRVDNPGLLILSNTPPLGFPRAQMTGLEPCTDYKLYVKAVCETGVNESAFAEITFSTLCEEETCGRYKVTFDNGRPVREQGFVTYMNCAGNYQTVGITNTQFRYICMLQTAPGVPASIDGASNVEYIEPC